MALQLKNDGEDNGDLDDVVSVEEYPDIDGPVKYVRGIGDGTIDPDKINDLPTYTARPVMNTDSIGMAGKSAKTRKVAYRIAAIVAVLLALLVCFYGARYMISSGGKDFTDSLRMTEDELAAEYKITFTDNANRPKAIPQYSNGKVSVRTGKGLHVVYIDGKQVGINTDSRDYRFYGVGINDAQVSIEKKLKYEYDNCMVILNDMMEGNSTAYFYYNRANNDCLVLTCSESTNRVVSMTYFTDFNKVSAGLSMGD